MFKYVAKSQNGEVMTGELDAASRDQAVAMINGMGLFPVLVENRKSKKNGGLFRRVNKKQITIVLRQISTMISASIPIPLILQVLKSDEQNPALKEILETIHKDVVEGKSLSEAMSGYPKIFSSFVINMVEIGETNGKLDDAFERIAVSSEKDMKVAGKMKSAMIYPVILSVLAIVMVVFLSIKVVPTFAQLFLDFGGELPGITKVMMAISDFLQKYWAVLLVGIIGISVLVPWLWKKKKYRRVMEKLIMKIPVIKGIQVSKLMAKFSRTMSAMLDSGIPIIKSLNITKGSFNNLIYEESFDSVVKEVKNGSPLHQAIDNTELFTALVVSMTKIGEESGKVGELLNNTAVLYEEEVERKIQAAISMMEPLITIVMGIAIAFIVASIIIPMFDMYSLIA